MLLVSGVKKFLRKRLVKGNHYFDFAQMVRSDIFVSDQKPFAQMHSNGGIHQVSNASEHREEHGNSDASSSKQKLKVTKFEPGKVWFLEKKRLLDVSSLLQQNKHKILMKSHGVIWQSSVEFGGVISSLSSYNIVKKLVQISVKYIQIFHEERIGMIFDRDDKTNQ